LIYETEGSDRFFTTAGRTLLPQFLLRDALLLIRAAATPPSVGVQFV
jgi:hypothetical protein